MICCAPAWPPEPPTKPPGRVVENAAGPGGGKPKLAEQTGRVDKLALENQALRSSVSISALEKAALEKRLQQRQAPAAAAPAGTSDEVKALRARLAVDEAQAVPYTPEELALLKSAAPAPATNAVSQEKSVT
jgi:hypothetical protein